MTQLKLRRVAYGKSNTKDEDKEYQREESGWFGPVGTLSEWKKAFPNCEIIFLDKDGEGK